MEVPDEVHCPAGCAPAKDAAPAGGLPPTSPYAALEARLGRERLGTRLELQLHHAADAYGGRGRLRLHPENIEPLYAVLDFALRAMGLAQRGRRNAADYRLVRVEHRLPGLPKTFDGFTLLHLSDIHADGLVDPEGALEALLAAIPCDLAVLTGDYRFATHDDYAPCMARMAGIVAALAPTHGTLAILGNHDFVETAPLLEALGVSVLLNESWTLEREGGRLFVAGVDDPHFYAGHDLERALDGRKAGDAVVLLAHTPELYQEAVRAGVQLYLCGHTHGGQICLPGGFPIITNAACPRRLTRGTWNSNGMRGHTSRGTGSSGLAVRFFCPPEIILHTLRCPSPD